MRLRYAFPLLITLAAASFSLRADQDDIENNADLQPTPEECARAAVLKRWPDATEIDSMDMAADEENAGDADKKMDAEQGKDVADDDKDMDKDDDKDDAADRTDWTISVLFKSAGKDYEALTDDDGKIQYVYETIPVDKAPQNIVDAARKAVNGDDDDDDDDDNGNVIFCQKCSDESRDKPVLIYIVGVGPKDVELDLDGKVLKIKDAPPDAEDKDDDGGDEMKMRI